MTAPYDESPARPIIADSADFSRYRSTTQEPSDFDEFWRETLDGSPAALRREVVQAGLDVFMVEDLLFRSFDGAEVRAWIIRPASVDRPLPAVVTTVGYGHGRGQPHEHLIWPSAGFITFVLDPRRPGGPAADEHSSGNAVVSGISSPHTYHYRKVIADHVALFDLAANDPGVDGSNIVVAGTSQAGGLALAAAGLRVDIRAVVVEIPFLCDWPRGIEIADRGPFADVAEYGGSVGASLESVCQTLSYFDGVSFARRSSAPALFSVALRDRVCPPSTVYAAFNEYAGPKELTVFPFNGHEGGGPAHVTRRIHQLKQRLANHRPAPP